jgi:2-dehydropantoate 2-reductase
MAAWLARSGHDVSVVARGAHLEAIRRSGLRVRSNGSVESFPVRADSDPARLGHQDYVLVTVKAQSLTDVASHIKNLVDDKTSIGAATERATARKAVIGKVVYVMPMPITMGPTR